MRRVWPLRLSVGPCQLPSAPVSFRAKPYSWEDLDSSLVTPRLSGEYVWWLFMLSRGKLSLIRDDELAHVSVKCQTFNTCTHLCAHIYTEGER